MNLKKVKLVVSDMDGTLLNDKGEVSSLFLKLFKKFQQNNIHFIAASGRQYNSIIHKLSTIKNDIYVIAENGAIAKKGNKTLLSHTLNPEEIMSVIPVLRNIDNANIILCGRESAYVESKDERFISYFQEYYQSYYQVDDLLEIVKTTPILKIAVHHTTSSEEFIYPVIKNLQNDVLLKISGQNWLDISDKKANKGSALREVQKILNITKAETMVFGDYHNDIEMLQEADFSFAMENAHMDIKEIANYSAGSNNHLGVETVLEQLIDAKNNQ